MTGEFLSTACATCPYLKISWCFFYQGVEHHASSGNN